MTANHSVTPRAAMDLVRQLRLIEKYVSEPTITHQPADFKPEDMVVLPALIEVAKNVKTVRGFGPRDTQLIAVLSFLKGDYRLLQAATGQGKSLMVAMTAILEHQLKIPFGPTDPKPMAVHVVAPTSNLANAGLDENRDLFKQCGVPARSVREKGASSDVVYGTPLDFEGRALLEATESRVPKQLLDPNVRRAIILDESDSLLIDGAAGRVSQSDKDPQELIVKEVMLQIAERVRAGFKAKTIDSPYVHDLAITFQLAEGLRHWVSKNHPDFVGRWEQDGTTWIDNALEVLDPAETNPWRDGARFVEKKSFAEELAALTATGFFREIERVNRPQANAVKLALLQISHDLGAFIELDERVKAGSPIDREAEIRLSKSSSKQLVDLLTVLKPMKLPSVLRSQYWRLISMADELIASSDDKSDESILPVIRLGAIQYLDVGTGQIVSRMKFKNGIQEFLELREFGSIVTKPTVSVRTYSLKKYVHGADLVLGLSGTVGVDDRALMAFQNTVWGMAHTTVLPEYAEPQLRMSAAKRHLPNERAWLAGVTDAARARSATQPVLVIAENVRRAWQLMDELEQHGINASLYAETSDDYLLRQKLAPGDVIVTTNLGGRGSDYKYDDEKAPEGLHVIIAFDSDEERVLAQARGRAGRAGAPGTWQQICFGSPLRQKPNLVSLKNSVEQTIAEDMIFDVYSALTKTVEELPDEGQQKAFKALIMTWLSNPSVRAALSREMLVPGKADNNELALRILREHWGAYLKQPSLPVDGRTKASFLEFMRKAPTGGGAHVGTVIANRLAEHLTPDRAELERIRLASP